MNGYFGEKVGKLQRIEKCYYTITKSEDWLVDWTDEHQNVLIVSPCSGHGFKFSPIIGQIVADLLDKNQSIPLFEQYRNLMQLSFHKDTNME
jgi:glycine/D-amino acid oxidase-like deaminating enzyme